MLPVRSLASWRLDRRSRWSIGSTFVILSMHIFRLCENTPLQQSLAERVTIIALFAISGNRAEIYRLVHSHPGILYIRGKSGKAEIAKRFL